MRRIGIEDSRDAAWFPSPGVTVRKIVGSCDESRFRDVRKVHNPLVLVGSVERSIGEQHSDVFDHYLLVGTQFFDSVVHHDVAERTAGSDDISVAADRFLGTFDVDFLAGLFLEPHLAAARTAAECLGAVAGHLDSLPN